MFCSVDYHCWKTSCLVITLFLSARSRSVCMFKADLLNMMMDQSVELSEDDSRSFLFDGSEAKETQAYKEMLTECKDI